MIKLDNLFIDENLDIEHISKRINATFNYFHEPINDLVHKIIYKIEEVQGTKNAKAFYDE